MLSSQSSCSPHFSDAKTAMEFLNGMCSEDNNMFWRHTIDKDGHLQNLFWCDGRSRTDYSVFGDVLAFDVTYQKAGYLCPLIVLCGDNHHNKSIVFAAAIVRNETEDTYVWLLESFLEAMNGKSPDSVITDGDTTMRKAIGRVFPRAHHRLCAWHLIRNAPTNIKGTQFVSKFKQCMSGDIDVSEFNQKWKKMVEEFGLHENLWALETYEKRSMWATCHIRNFFAGFRATSRCKGLDSEFGKYVNVLSNLLDFLKQFFRWLEYMRYRETKAKFASSTYGEPVLQTQYHNLEKSSAIVFTKEIHKLFCQVLQRACNYFVACSKNSHTNFIYTIYRYDKQGIQWVVSFSELSLEFKCSCLRFESLGIPCEHIVCVLLFLGIERLPEGLILKRWSKCAKDGLTIPSCERGLIYVCLLEQCMKMVTALVDCGNPELFRNTMELIDRQTAFFEAVGRGEDIEIPYPDPYNDVI